jgi:AraC-like DNA-binding protein
MIYKEVVPNPKLTDLVRSFWCFQNTSTNTLSYTVLPDGNVDLIIKIKDNDLESVDFYGIWTKQIEVEIKANTTVWAVTFKPLAIEYLFKKSIAQLLNGYEHLDFSTFDINTFPLNDFHKFVERITTVFLNHPKTDNRKIELFNLLFDNNGSLTVEKLSNQLFWQSRQINRYFKAQFGLSLKAYANILRCFASYTPIKAGILVPNDDFYDQSHFIKEIKKHTGVKPTELYENKNDRFLQFHTLGQK